jgi:hypothetical protein
VLLKGLLVLLVGLLDVGLGVVDAADKVLGALLEPLPLLLLLLDGLGEGLQDLRL